MHFISQYLEFVLHLNVHLVGMISAYGSWVYLIVFLIIFFESGIILTPFLPGESLLFAIGATAATGALNVHWIVILLSTAAIIGGFINYGIGLTTGKWLFKSDKKSLFQKYIQQTHTFYEKHGTLTIMLARFLPIIRTYAPFVAGVARMNFLLFCIYNIIGGILWITFFYLCQLFLW